jgi:hypothetical protein
LPSQVAACRNCQGDADFNPRARSDTEAPEGQLSAPG